MHQKSYTLFYILIGLVSIFIIQLFYLQQTKSMTPTQQLKKEYFVTIAGLPDLALVTETSSVRHRTLSDLFSLYRDDANLREYFPSTFAYAHSPILNKDSSIEKH
ncbi:hypothetical protein KKC13_10805 [bacterium]|nr:hypothetical protein [bacterium]MBU1958216.1 hypothetical protein [bacterium]